MTLAECTAAWLEATGKKQKVVAERAGFGQPKLSDLLSGNNPDPRWSTVEKLAKGFGVSVAEFLAGPRPEGAIRAESSFGGEGGGAGLAGYLGELFAHLKGLNEQARGDFIRGLVAVLTTIEHARPAARGGAAQNNER